MIFARRRRRRQAAEVDCRPPSARRLLAGALMLLVSGSVANGAKAQDERPSFRATTETVLLQVSVLDEDGDPVRGLEVEDFTVYEDGLPQEITFFEHEAVDGNDDHVPTSIALLIDTSSSMDGSEIVEARKAALRFIEEAPAHAEIAVIGFDQTSRVVHDFTTDRAALSEAIHGLQTRGGTALYDGMVDTIDLLERSPGRRHLMVVLGDGKDLDSSSSFSDVRCRLETSPVVIYSVGYFSPRDRKLYVNGDKYYKPPSVEVNLNPAWVLGEAARISGGTVFFPLEPAELTPAFEKIAHGLRFQYLLGYAPPPSDGKPRFRTIDVDATAPAEAGSFTVRTRGGYVR